MPDFFILLLKINVVLILFAAAYYLILRRLTFYSINRGFLIFGIVFSSTYPFIDLTALFEGKAVPEFVPKLAESVNALVKNESIEMFWKLLVAVFYAGVAFMTLRLLIQLISLRRIHQKSAPGYVANYRVRILQGEVSPFSFWKTIYINPLLHKKQDLNNIVAHERVHVEEWHTIDILLAEISIILYWFNPGVWLMKRAVKENIEFITDAKILRRGIDKKAYQYSLLDVGSLRASVAIVNNFNLSDLKKRIRMMNVKRSSRLTLSRYVFVLPFLLVLTLAFTINKKQVRLQLEPIRRALQQVELLEKPAIVKNEKPSKIKYLAQLRNKKVGARIADTIKTKPVFTIFIKMDSTNVHPKADEIDLVKVKDLKITGVGFKAVNDPDAKGLNDQLSGVVQGVKLPNAADKSDAEPKVITVIGYASRAKRSDPQVRLRGVDNSAIDSVQNVARIRYQVNGKDLNAKDLNTLDPKNIKSVVVKKGNQSPDEVVVVGRRIQK